MNMKIILNQDVPNLGEEGDVCVVKDGYALVTICCQLVLRYCTTTRICPFSRAEQLLLRRER